MRAPLRVIRGNEQFEIVAVGIAEVDPHASDRATDLNIEPTCAQARFPCTKLGDGTHDERDMVEGLLARVGFLRATGPQDEFEVTVGVSKECKIAVVARLVEPENVAVPLDTLAHVIDVQTKMCDAADLGRCNHLRRLPDYASGVQYGSSAPSGHTQKATLCTGCAQSVGTLSPIP